MNINYHRIASKLLQDIHEQERLVDLMKKGTFSLGSAAMQNLDSDTSNWSGSSCYLTSTDDPISSIFSRAIEGAKKRGSTGITLTNMDQDSAKEFMLATDKMINLINMEHERAGAVNFIIPCYSDVTLIAHRLCDMAKSQYLKVGTVTLGLNKAFLDAVERDEEFTFYDLSLPECQRLNGCYGPEFDKVVKELKDVKYQRRNAKEVLVEYIRLATGNKSPMFVDFDNMAGLCPQRPEGLDWKILVNLCLEVIQFGKDGFSPVCNLGSFSLAAYVKQNYGPLAERIDFKRLGSDVQLYQKVLTQVTYGSTYDNEAYHKASRYFVANGLGVTGFHECMLDAGLDLFESKRLWQGVEYSRDSFSKEVKELNELIFACIYFNSVKASNQHVIDKVYPRCPCPTTYDQGKFRFDLVREHLEWRRGYSENMQVPEPSLWGQDDSWSNLRASMVEHGLANSLLLTQMPTSTSSRRRGESMMCELQFSNIYTQKTYEGIEHRVNTRALKHAESIGVDPEAVVNYCTANKGSLQGFTYDTADPNELSRFIANYRTVWDVKQRVMYDMAIARNKYYDQSMSQNMYMEGSDLSPAYSAILYGAGNGLGCALYYLTTRKETERTQVCESCTA